ncbi:iron-sulfur cluster biosynthesis family protein [Herbiconiux sp. SYSU D00978]|uniref:iron-sulfur cluster biosynthesis family protein n=1 Tax=Herbiconiux sp. SYSU D00978 TaxID=2812562 RepID=UPI0027DBA441|nr:iron-sulfur cluster biosynthesis family protein [Herbiconiux sp. SYSU D00978]
MTLTMTDTASTVVKTIAAQSAGSEHGGIRIAGADPGTGSDFSLSIAPEAAPQDVVVENDGARVFLDESAAQALDDTVLDAQINEDGSVRFAIGARH